MDPYGLWGATETPNAKEVGSGPDMAAATIKAKSLADMAAIGSIPVFVVALVITVAVLSKYE